MFLIQKIALTALIAVSALTAFPVEADARDRHHRHAYGHRDNDRWDRDDRRDYRRDYRRDDRRGHYRDRRYYQRHHCRRGSGTTGLIVGGAAGALLGREVDRYGDRLPGTIIGGAAGALIGREVDRGGRC
ncbi:glycine zipper 2TM domain-containing protein [Sphingopyxis fribergensis]